MRRRPFNLKAGIRPGTDRLPVWTRTEALLLANAVFDIPQEEIDELFNF